jgi:hypothetical protein
MHEGGRYVGPQADILGGCASPMVPSDRQAASRIDTPCALRHGCATLAKPSGSASFYAPAGDAVQRNFVVVTIMEPIRQGENSRRNIRDFPRG